MQNQATEIKAFILANVSKYPTEIVKMGANKFSVTATTVHRHIASLIKSGLLTKTGNTRSTKYSLQNEYERLKTYSISKNIAEHNIFYDDFEDIFKRLNSNLYKICSFGVTEMLNNALDHSRGSRLSLETKFVAPEFTIVVQDDGVGAFKSICNYLQIEDIREGILHISKGKVTSDPVNHSGQGIFFTSKMFDIFTIMANGYSFTKNNILEDWTFTSSNIAIGTKVIMVLNVDSKTNITDIFSAYEGDDWAFEKTEIMVQLADLGDNLLVSRSQAKRILLGLEKFALITFNFKKIDFIGQGFADEIFRVFARNNTRIEIKYINANDDVKFMIERSIERIN